MSQLKFGQNPWAKEALPEVSHTSLRVAVVLLLCECRRLALGLPPFLFSSMREPISEMDTEQPEDALLIPSTSQSSKRPWLRWVGLVLLGVSWPEDMVSRCRRCEFLLKDVRDVVVSQTKTRKNPCEFLGRVAIPTTCRSIVLNHHLI